MEDMTTIAISRDNNDKLKIIMGTMALRTADEVMTYLINASPKARSAVDTARRIRDVK